MKVGQLGLSCPHSAGGQLGSDAPGVVVEAVNSQVDILPFISKFV